MDEAWAEWIAWELEAAGSETMMQKWDFTLGKNFVLEMQDAISYANRLVLILSESFLLSDFTKPEWAAFFSADPTGKKGTLIPIRVEECKPPGLLRQIVYVDFVGASESECRQRLLAAIKSWRRKPQKKPVFPGFDTTSTELSPHFPNSEKFARYRISKGNLLRSLHSSHRAGKRIPFLNGRTIGRAFVREILEDYGSRQMFPSSKSRFREMSFVVIDVDGMSGINKRLA